MHKFLKITIALALIAAMLCSTAMAATYSAKILKPSSPVYNSAKQKVGTLKSGTSIKVTSMSGDWARITYDGNTLYAKLEDIIFNKRIRAVSVKSSPIRFVTRESYRENTYYKATLSEGVTLYVVGLNGSELLVTNESGSALGYVKRSAVVKN